MNLKQKIEEWEKTKKEISPWPWIEYKPDDYHGRGISDKNGAKIPNHDTDIPFIVSAPKNYDAAMQALKEAAEIMDKIGLEENEVNATLVKPTESDVELKILNAYLKDFWSAPRRWRKKWGFDV